MRIYPAFYFKDSRRRDKDNFGAMLKAAYDGLADAGLVENDTNITPMPARFLIDKHDPRVELIIKQEE